jgi:phosphate:Na+ symporter
MTLDRQRVTPELWSNQMFLFSLSSRWLMDPLPLLGHGSRVWRISLLFSLHRHLGRLRPILLVVAIGLLLWVLKLHLSLEQVAAGVAIFLFGMFFLEQGFSRLASAQWRRGVRQLTSSMSRAFGLGLFATLLTQSSALVALLTLSFLSAGMLDFLAGIAIMAGANLGTTSGGWLMASLGLKLGFIDSAFLLLVVGMLLISMPRWGTRGLGMVISGVGFLFLGIEYIKTGFLSLSGLIELSHYAMSGWQGIGIYFLIGILVTLVMQSSHAAILLCMAALNAGQLEFDNGLALVLGINIGATGPVLLGAAHSSLEGKRLAWLDLFCKVLTAVCCLLAFYPLRRLTDGLGDLLGLQEQDLALRLALYHTLFNLFAIAWLLPLREQASRVMTRILPPHASHNVAHACYLDRVVAVHPVAAEQALIHEIVHLFHECQVITARGMLGMPWRLMLTHPTPELVPLGEDLPNLQRLYLHGVKPLFGEIITFAALCKTGMGREQAEQIDALVAVARSMTEVIRLQRQLQSNLLQVLANGSDLLQLRYKALQRRLLLFNREVRQLFDAPEPESIRGLLALEVKRVVLQSRRDREDIELLIRSNKLGAIDAASLMNDSQTLRRIQRQQLKALQTLTTHAAANREVSATQLLAWLQQQESLTESRVG